jgi:hypothetical protein
MKIILEQKPRKKVLNRFSTSALYYLLNGWTTVEEYVDGKPISREQKRVMREGTKVHLYVQEFLKEMGYECEIKKVLETDGIQIVCKVDALKEEHGLEIKSSAKLRKEATRSHIYQAKWYAHLFQRDFYIVQPEEAGGVEYLQTIGIVHPPKQKWVDSEISKILIKYEEIKKYELSKM